MKKIFLLLLSFIFVTVSQAQQEAQYTQFMFNKLALNPAYAGSAELPCVSALYRNQWIGLEGRPVSQILNFHMPILRNRVGIGMSILHDKIGVTSSLSYELKYSYRISINKWKLGLGLQGSLRRYQIDWSEGHAIHAGDNLLAEDINSRLLPNFGFGLYFQGPQFYLGFSLPHLLKGDLSFKEIDGSSNYSREARHTYFIAGLLLQASKNTKFKPEFY